MEEIRIKYHADIERIEKIVEGDWIDLRASEDVFIPVGEYKLIPLGVSMQLPMGYEAHVCPRSSTFKNYGIIMTNSMGIIDNTYCGDNDVWQFPAYCLESRTGRNDRKGTMIHKGDRICQFRIVENQPKIFFDEVESLGNANRGGIGSTGVK